MWQDEPILGVVCIMSLDHRCSLCTRTSSTKRISHESWARRAIAVFSRGLCSHTPAQVQFDSPGSLAERCVEMQPPSAQREAQRLFLGLWDCRSPRSAPIELEGETERNKFRSGRCTSLLQGGGLRQKRGNSPDA